MRHSHGPRLLVLTEESCVLIENVRTQLVRPGLQHEGATAGRLQLAVQQESGGLFFFRPAACCARCPLSGEDVCQGSSVVDCD